MTDEFYIGYEETTPRGLASRVRLVAIFAVVLGLLLPGLLVVAQARFATGVFEFGRERELEGRVSEFPYPVLAIADTSSDPRAVSHYWLVGPGKHGAASLVKGLDGQTVRLSGSLIERDGDRMIQVAPGSVKTVSIEPGASTDPLRFVAQLVLVGEIADSKCHLGVMKPGEGPTHRDCAVRCLLGDIPPMLVVHSRHSGLGRVTLIDANGSAFSQPLQSLAGKPVVVRGRLLERGTEKYLATSLSQIESIEN